MIRSRSIPENPFPSASAARMRCSTVISSTRLISARSAASALALRRGLGMGCAWISISFIRDSRLPQNAVDGPKSNPRWAADCESVVPPAKGAGTPAARRPRPCRRVGRLPPGESQIQLRVRQLGDIRGALQIDVVGRLVEVELPGERRLADLPGAQQRHHRTTPEALLQRGGERSALPFTLKLRNRFRIYKVNCRVSANSPERAGGFGGPPRPPCPGRGARSCCTIGQ